VDSKRRIAFYVRNRAGVLRYNCFEMWLDSSYSNTAWRLLTNQTWLTVTWDLALAIRYTAGENWAKSDRRVGPVFLNPYGIELNAEKSLLPPSSRECS